MDSAVLVLAVVVAAGIVGGLVGAVVMLLRRRGLERAVRPAFEPDGSPQLYVALDASTVLGLHAQTRYAGTIRREVDQRSHTGRASAGTPPLVIEVGRNTDRQTEIEYLPVEDAFAAASIVEQELDRDNRITTFDLKAPTDDGPLSELLVTLHAGAHRIGLTVPREVDEGLRAAWRQQGRPVTRAMIESRGPFVRVRAEFSVCAGASEGDRVLETAGAELPGVLRVRVSCPRRHLYDSFPDAPGTVTATCLGTLIGSVDEGLLDLRPISVRVS